MLRWMIVALGVFTVSCDARPVLDRGGVEVAASLPPHTWLIEAIGGEDVTVRSVLEPGDSPATYQPGDAEVSSVLRARVFFRTGVPFEAGGWFDAVSSRLEVVDLRNGIELRSIEAHRHPSPPGAGDHRHDDAAPDPHIWLSPKRLPAQARTIAASLRRLLPERAAGIDQRLQRVIRELAALDHEIEAMLDRHRGRTFVVFHPSWGYFADDYGLRQVAIETGGKEPSDAEITELRETIRELGVTVVFVQPQIAGRSAAAVAEAAGARLEALDPLRADLVENLRDAATRISRSFDE
jgi:zinc transport system substrate-binding protein